MVYNWQYIGYIKPKQRDILSKTMGYIGLRIWVILWDMVGKYYGMY